MEVALVFGGEAPEAECVAPALLERAGIGRCLLVPAGGEGGDAAGLLAVVAVGGGELSYFGAAGGDGAERCWVDVGEVAGAVADGSPPVAELFGEVVADGLSGEVAGGGGVGEQGSGGDGAGVAVGVGGDVVDDDVVVELGFEVAVAGVAVLDGPHAVGGDALFAGSDVEAVVLEVGDAGADAEVQCVLDDLAGGGVGLDPRGADRLLPFEGGVVGDDDVRFCTRADEPLGLVRLHSPPTGTVTRSVERLHRSGVVLGIAVVPFGGEEEALHVGRVDAE